MHRDWTEVIRAKFIENIAATGNVAEAARLTGVSRAHAYTVKALDREFSIAWCGAMTKAAYAVEYEARRRALEIVEEPLVRAGKPIYAEDGAPIVIRRYNDRMLIHLLTRIQRRTDAASRFERKNRKAADKAAGHTEAW